MSAERQIRLNPALDWAQYAAVYARDGIVQVPNFLDEESAAWLADSMKEIRWHLSMSDESGKGKMLSPKDIEVMGNSMIALRLRDLIARAGRNFAFAFLAYPIIEQILKGEDEGHATHALVKFMNNPEFLEVAKALTGAESLTKIDAQATLFRKHDFLGLHNDTGTDDERRAAYTIGLTRDWRADWGGQLLFHDEQGNVTRGFKPGFNVWTVFRTPQWHSVSQVANYAPEPRLSITGWLRDDPPFKDVS